MRGISTILFGFLLLIPPGASAAQFNLPKPIPGETQTIDVAGSTLLVKGLTHQANQVFVNGREIPVQPDGTFSEEIIVPLGETEMVVETKNPEGARNTYRKTIKAKADYFFLAGLADGTLNFSDASGGFTLERADGKHYRNGFRPGGKLSYYAVGKLHGEYLFKSALDTDKDTEEKLFTTIDPDKYYPIYGDNSTVVYDVNSQGKFYGLFEWDKSGAVFGNYQTQIEEDSAQLARYNRTLYGGKIHLETPSRTVYGDPVNQTTLFWSEANQRAGHSELLATGGSLYYLRHRNIMEGSEQVRLEVRDKNAGMAIQSLPQARDTDYEIKYDEGRILFKRPILTVAASDTVISSSILEGNPVYVVVNYEYESQDAFPIISEDLDNQSGGFRFSQYIGDHVQGGVTYLQEQKDGQHYKLYGGDSTLKIGNFTQVNAEWAKSEADSTRSYISYNGGYDYTELSIDNLADGTALRVEANSSLGEYFGKKKGFLDVSGYWRRIGKKFSPADSLFEGGTKKEGFEVSHEITMSDRLKFAWNREDLEKGSANRASENQLQAKRIQNLTTQWAHHWRKWLFTSEYLFKDEREFLNPLSTGKDRVKGHVVGERIQYDLSSLTSVYLGQQLGLTDLNDSFTTVGWSSKLDDRSAFHGQVGAGPMGNSVLAGIERWTDANHSDYSNWLRTRSATDGNSSVFSFGSNTQISENAKLGRERQFVTSDTRGSYAANLIGYEHQVTPEFRYDISYQRRDERQRPVTLTGSEARDATSMIASLIIPDEVKFSSRVEHRYNTDNLWQVVLDNQGELKVTKDLYLFGEYEYSKAKESLSAIDKKQVGIAFRPVDFDWFNALFKYIRLSDDRPQNIGSADGGFVISQSQSDVIASEYALDLPRRFQFVQKLAFKDEDLLAANPTNTVKTPDNLQAWLWVHRLNYHVTNRIDAAVEYRRLRQRGSSSQSKEGGVLLEFTYQIVKRLAVGAGFNFTDFVDDLTVKTEKSARGFFLRLQAKY